MREMTGCSPSWYALSQAHFHVHTSRIKAEPMRTETMTLARDHTVCSWSPLLAKLCLWFSLCSLRNTDNSPPSLEKLTPCTSYFLYSSILFTLPPVKSWNKIAKMPSTLWPPLENKVFSDWWMDVTVHTHVPINIMQSPVKEGGAVMNPGSQEVTVKKQNQLNSGCFCIFFNDHSKSWLLHRAILT